MHDVYDDHSEKTLHLEQFVSSGLLTNRETTVFCDVENTNKTVYAEQYELIAVSLFKEVTKHIGLSYTVFTNEFSPNIQRAPFACDKTRSPRHNRRTANGKPEKRIQTNFSKDRKRIQTKNS